MRGSSLPIQSHRVMRPYAPRARLAGKAGLVGGFIFASRACRARLACLAHALHSRSSRNEVGMGPSLLETILDLGRLAVLLLILEALDQSDQRPAVFGISRQIRSILGFGIS